MFQPHLHKGPSRGYALCGLEQDQSYHMLHVTNLQCAAICRVHVSNTRHSYAAGVAHNCLCRFCLWHCRVEQTIPVSLNRCVRIASASFLPGRFRGKSALHILVTHCIFVSAVAMSQQVMDKPWTVLTNAPSLYRSRLGKLCMSFNSSSSCVGTSMSCILTSRPDTQIIGTTEAVLRWCRDLRACLHFLHV